MAAGRIRHRDDLDYTSGAFADPFGTAEYHAPMAERLLLRLGTDGSLAWLRQGVRGLGALGSQAGPPPPSALAGVAEIVVLVPADDVLLTEVQLGARSRAQLLQAVPFAVEDQLLSPVEDLHFGVAAARGAGAPVGIAVVARSRMREWVERLAELGIRPDVLVPESLALPLVPGQATVLLDGARAIVRLGPWSAFACSVAELPGWLAQMRAGEGDGLPPLALHDGRAGAPAPLELPAAIASRAEDVRDALALLAAGLGAPALNLLDGEFALRHRHARGARWWRVAAALAAAVLVLAFANLGFDVLQLSRASARIDTLAQDAVRRAFPDVDAAQLGRVSPEQLMRARLDRLRGGSESSGLLRMLAQIAPVLGSTTRIQTRGMEYRNGALELALRAPDVASLDLVRERFAALPGLKVDVTAANPGSAGVDGRIRIAGVAP